MARKPNIFGKVMNEIERERAEEGQSVAGRSASPPAPQSDQAIPAQIAPIPAAFRRGPVGALGNDLRASMGQTLREIDPGLIDASPFADRIEIRDEDVLDLAESIRKHGLRVPILLRPNPSSTGRFIIVYGRRRLAALRLIGQPARALIKDMSEEESILAQGQENYARVDPSFIEKALFARALDEAGYSNDVLAEALCVSKPYLSHMRRPLDNIPADTIRQIGAAHGVGWKRWHEAVDIIVNKGVSGSVRQGLFEGTEESAERFRLWLEELSSDAPAAPPPVNQRPIVTKRGIEKLPVYASDNGKRIGEVRKTGDTVCLFADPKQKEFSSWLSAHGEDVLTRIYSEWASTKDGGT